MFALLPLLMGVLPSAAEWIGKLIAGERGAAVAESLTGVVQQVVGSSDPAEAQRFLDTNPGAVTELRVQLQRVLAENEVELAKQRNATLEIEAQNTADARSRDVEVVRAGGSTRMRDTVAISTIVVFILSATGSVTAIMLSADSIMVALVNVILGATIGGYNNTVNFFLGSSLGSTSNVQTTSTAVRIRPNPS
ncbi:hypothetical protein EOD42_22640 [Rhodovarius crocodyli]|uniref:Uncharacterized protein n=1 Tax=Rhodovarius crocodyli TaxID=1979269 RepID=A0A437M1B0_9PROT|nr:hypothetical protein [Rhodovarius crocodyli]RVT91457.1 hypothetical protein EOD42_22640 [Rhodovarius crocodyli]